MAGSNSALSTLHHKGPGSEGEWVDHNAKLFLGHRRLSILDKSDSGQSPMFSNDARYVIVLNG